jgi:hypothetical protein
VDDLVPAVRGDEQHRRLDASLRLDELGPDLLEVGVLHARILGRIIHHVIST